MPVAALTTLGCKVNQYETEKIAEDFAGAGFALTDFDAPADVYVINSCSVTQSADRKSRYLARKASRTNPNAVVVMTGCHSQMTLDAGEWVEGATLLVPNDEKMRVFEHVLRARPDVLTYSSSPAVALPPRGHARTRATLKVQDGCEHFLRLLLDSLHAQGVGIAPVAGRGRRSAAAGRDRGARDHRDGYLRRRVRCRNGVGWTGPRGICCCASPISRASRGSVCRAFSRSR